MQNKDRTLVLGVGNYLMGDEGIGIHVARKLADENMLPTADVVDGGTGGFHLLEYFESHKTVILIDATLDGNTPGYVRMITPRFASDFPIAMSTHDIGLKDLIIALQLLNKMPTIYLFVVSINNIQQQGIELTPAVQAVIPLLIEKIKSRATA